MANIYFEFAERWNKDPDKVVWIRVNKVMLPDTIRCTINEYNRMYDYLDMLIDRRNEFINHYGE